MSTIKRPPKNPSVGDGVAPPSSSGRLVSRTDYLRSSLGFDEADTAPESDEDEELEVDASGDAAADGSLQAVLTKRTSRLQQELDDLSDKLTRVR